MSIVVATDVSVCICDGKYYYAVVKTVCMSSNKNVALGGTTENIKIFSK